MQLSLWPQRVALEIREPLRNELRREDRQVKSTARLISRPASIGPVDNVDCISFVEKPRSPSTAAIWFVQEVLRTAIVSITGNHGCRP